MNCNRLLRVMLCFLMVACHGAEDMESRNQQENMTSNVADSSSGSDSERLTLCASGSNVCAAPTSDAACPQTMPAQGDGCLVDGALCYYCPAGYFLDVAYVRECQQGAWAAKILACGG